MSTKHTHTHVICMTGNRGKDYDKDRQEQTWVQWKLKCKCQQAWVCLRLAVCFCYLLEMMAGLLWSLPELGVAGEFAWLACADTLAASTAVLTAYRFASSWNLPMFFLYRILLLPNQFETWSETTPIRQIFMNSLLIQLH